MKVHFQIVKIILGTMISLVLFTFQRKAQQFPLPLKPYRCIDALLKFMKEASWELKIKLPNPALKFY